MLLDTTKGRYAEMRREWRRTASTALQSRPCRLYDDARIFRIRAGTWAQFGINGDPAIAKAWRGRTIPDDPRRESNVRGTVAYAFKDPNGRTTQVFVNLRDNSETHDREPFVPFAKVIEGMDAADRWYSDYGERAGGGIRAGHQDPVFDGGNPYLTREFPQLDYIKKASLKCDR